ncbi:MAG: hypothetical protein QOE23_109 [Pseudonocardiales bacterium]|jgi:hypothetical protein|nr:hypothetical protein [Pseudonocardiales bacterium]
MSEFGKKVSEEVLGQQEETPERGRPGTNPPAEPQPGLHPGAGEAPDDAAEQDQPAQGFGEPDSY